MFKVGDKVKCIDDTDFGKGILKKGNIYTISRASINSVRLEETDDWCFVDTRFIKVEEETAVTNKKEERKEEKEEDNKMEKDLMKETLEQKIIESILPDIKKKVMKQCKDITKNITTVVVKLDNEIIKQSTENTHNKFKDLLTLVNNNIPAMLTGGAGSGKSSTCEKVAKALRTRFLF